MPVCAAGLEPTRHIGKLQGFSCQPQPSKGSVPMHHHSGDLTPGFCRICRAALVLPQLLSASDHAQDHWSDCFQVRGIWHQQQRLAPLSLTLCGSDGTVRLVLMPVQVSCGAHLETCWTEASVDMKAWPAAAEARVMLC